MFVKQGSPHAQEPVCHSSYTFVHKTSVIIEKVQSFYALLYSHFHASIYIYVHIYMYIYTFIYAYTQHTSFAFILRINCIAPNYKAVALLPHKFGYHFITRRKET